MGFAKGSTHPTKPEMGTLQLAHAVYVGDRINTANFPAEALSSAPLAVQVGEAGIAVLFRYGVIVFIGVAAGDELKFLEQVTPRITSKFSGKEEETATIRLVAEQDDQVSVGGSIDIKAMSLERLLIIADVLAKSVVLAHDEREVAKVFEIIEPFAQALASRGRTPRNRTGILKLIGSALLVQHRVSGRVAVTEKPDALWDRYELERLYARLEDEYELKERFDTLNRKLAVVSDTADTLADMIDTRRSLRLEIVVVLLIAFEIVVTFYQIFAAQKGH
jgi:required for meiotic nuclear division protein 1